EFIQHVSKLATAESLLLPQEKLGGKISGGLLENLQGFSICLQGFVVPTAVPQPPSQPPKQVPKPHTIVAAPRLLLDRSPLNWNGLLQRLLGISLPALRLKGVRQPGQCFHDDGVVVS